jgi:ankyrin repeat protein
MNIKRLFLTLLLIASSLSIKAMQREMPSEEETQEEPISFRGVSRVRQWINEVKKTTKNYYQAEKFIVQKLKKPENESLKTDYPFMRDLIFALAKEYNESPMYYLQMVRDKPSIVNLIAQEFYRNKQMPFPNSLLQAAQRGDKDGVTLYILVKREHPNQQDQFKRTPLHYVVDYPEIVAALLKYGADPNVPDQYGNTPLLNAVKIPNLQTILLLLQAGANPNPLPSLNLETPIGIASESGQYELLKILMDPLFTQPPAKKLKK